MEDPRGKDWFVGGPGRPGRPKFRKEAGSSGLGGRSAGPDHIHLFLFF